MALRGLSIGSLTLPSKYWRSEISLVGLFPFSQQTQWVSARCYPYYPSQNKEGPRETIWNMVDHLASYHIWLMAIVPMCLGAGATQNLNTYLVQQIIGWIGYHATIKMGIVILLWTRYACINNSLWVKGKTYLQTLCLILVQPRSSWQTVSNIVVHIILDAARTCVYKNNFLSGGFLSKNDILFKDNFKICKIY